MPKVITDKKKITELLTRGVAEVIERKSLEQKLRSGKQLRIKLGIDPTSPNLHLGRSIPLLKLRGFQELGHQVVFIVGDFTAVIGDTSDKDSERPMLTTEQVKKNMADYIKQAGKIVDTEKAEIFFNSKWLKKLDYEDIGEHASQFSLAEFIKRENIKKRFDAGKRISLHEILYPLMQGYDSVITKADVELGGTDQRFNLLAGRTLQEHYQQRPQDLLMTNLIEGTDGRKMSSSWGNTINVLDSSKEMFGKVMSLRDELIVTYLIHCTRMPMVQIAQLEKDIKTGANPRDIKIILAKELVSFYFDKTTADKEADNFSQQFSKRVAPQDIKVVKVVSKTLIEMLNETKLVSSKSDARRMIKQGAVKINQQKITDESASFKSGDIIQVGKLKYIKIK